MRGSGWATVTDCSYVYQAILEESNLQIHFMENSLFFEVFNSQVKKKNLRFQTSKFLLPVLSNTVATSYIWLLSN